MDSLTIANVRCFRESNTAPLSPLTLLVGENSTGKTTFLAMARLAWDAAVGHGRLDFNDPPFGLGTYDRIAHYHGGQGKRAPEIGVGCSVVVRRNREVEPSEVRFMAYFVERRGQPALSRWRLEESGDFLECKYAENDKYSVTISEDGVEKVHLLEMPGHLGTQKLPVSHFIELLRYRLIYPRNRQVDSAPEKDVVRRFQTLARLMQDKLLHDRPHALAPIRSEPLPTYQPEPDNPTTSGRHTPHALTRLRSEDDPHSKRTKELIQEFGHDAGLFESVQVRSLGNRKDTDPFRIQVQIQEQARPANIVDVGYGVSQALPVLLDSLALRKRLFLVQQPEVHLHPRAQAQLGTMFAHQARNGKRFIIETHSDYLLDRVCIEVRKKTISAESVSILFFSHAKGGVSITAIGIDNSGNISGAPENYREFFLQEQRRYLGS